MPTAAIENTWRLANMSGPSAEAERIDFSEALRGRRILEVSGGLAGAHCGSALAGLGAQVTAVRLPQGAQAAGGIHPLDTGKRVMALDPASDAGFEALASLAADSELFIEDRPPSGWINGGSLSARLSRRHPRLIAICISPFGISGPYADHPAYPLNCYHAGGNAQQIPCDPLRPEDRSRPPLQAGGQWGEAQAGTVAALAAVAALLDPAAHAGAIIDCAKHEALMGFNWTEVVRYANEGRSPSRLAPLATIVGGVLPTQDGFVQIAVREDHQWAALAHLLGRPQWIADPTLASRAARSARWREVARMIASETTRFTTSHLHRRGRESGIPIAAVMSLDELLSDQDLAARGAWAASQSDDGTTLRMPRWDTAISSAPSRLSTDPPPARDRALPPRFSARPGRPLAGLRVLDFGWVAMGPFVGYMLAGLGAEVIHIARPPPGAVAGVDLNAYNYGFDTLNTGKTWVGIDIRRPPGLELVHQLVARSDIVLNNFRPGVTRRLGIDYASLRAINPRLVMLSASTYGQSSIGGPYVGYAPVFSALGGLAALTGYPDGPPAEVSHPVDFFAGSVGVLGLLAGLHRLVVSGRGCHIDLAAREAILWSLSDAVARHQLAPGAEQRHGNGHPQMAPHGVYRCCGENRWLSLAVGSDAEWQALCASMGDPILAGDMCLATLAGRLLHRARIDQHIERWTATRDAGALGQRLRAAGVAAYLSATSEDLCKDPHVKARDALQSWQSPTGTRWTLAAPWHYREQPRQKLETTVGAAATQAVFADLLGLSPARIGNLMDEGVISRR